MRALTRWLLALSVAALVATWPRGGRAQSDGPEDELSRALRFLGASTDRQTVAECVERTSFERLSKRAGGLGRGRSRGSEDSTSFFRKGVAGDWKTVFTPADRETYKRIAGNLLVELGYESDRNW